MPDLSTDGLDVSAEEERYLRRTFRRFALPYVVLLMAFAWWVSSGAPAGDELEALDAVQAQLVELRASLQTLDGELAEARERARAAEQRAAKLEQKEDGASASELASLERDLRRATARIAALEKGPAAAVAQRFDALSDRIAGVERQLDRGASRGPLPAGPAAPVNAAPRPAPGPGDDIP